MNPTPEQLAKLPKWAQQHIAVLESNLEVQRMVRLINPGAPSPFWTQAYNEPRRFIQAPIDIRFGLPLGESHLFSIRPSEHQPERLQISSRLYCLTVFPKVGNVIEIGTEDF